MNIDWGKFAGEFYKQNQPVIDNIEIEGGVYNCWMLPEAQDGDKIAEEKKEGDFSYLEDTAKKLSTADPLDLEIYIFLLGHQIYWLGPEMSAKRMDSACRLCRLLKLYRCAAKMMATLASPGWNDENLKKKVVYGNLMWFIEIAKT